ncbi:MAG: hypothetical protein V4568_18665 [Pseudomonadota bacterium]
MNGRRAARGITWVEFSVALFLISVFVSLLLAALLRAEQAAEKSMFYLTVSELRSELLLRRAELMIGNRVQEMDALVGSNPAMLLHRSLIGYVGETNGPPDNEDKTWYFDRTRHELVYRFRRWSTWPFAGEEGPTEGRLSIKGRWRLALDARQTPTAEGIELVVQVKN